MQMSMPKFIKLYLFLALVCFPCYSEASYFDGIKGELKVSAFFPSSKTVRRSYSNVIPYYELEFSRKVFCGFEGFFGVGIMHDKGDAKGSHKHNQFTLVPLTLGLKYTWPIESWIDFYLGAGATWAYLNAHNHYYNFHQKIDDSSFGGVFKTGFVSRCFNCFTIDVFVEYLSQPFCFHRDGPVVGNLKHHLNMSGFKLGAGIVYPF